MDLDWSEEEEAFRREVRAFLRDNLDEDLVAAGHLATSVYPDHAASMRWQAILAARGWAAPHWPVEHGGQDWSAAQHYIFESERIAAGAPALSPMGIHMVAHVIVRYGSEAQKRWFLPRILSGEVFFCQGYSEPGAGSDLAALQLSARAEGDVFVLNGSKIWTTHATEANWMFALVRTAREDRPQKGITFLLLKMDAPGISVRPMLMASGEEVQSQVFFTDVRVPRENVLGEVGQGWSVAKYLLEFERGGSAYAPDLEVRARRLAEFAAERPGGGGCALIDDPLFAGRLAALRARIAVLGTLELRLLSRAGRGESLGALSSMMKVLGTETAQTLTRLTLEAAGPRALAYQPHAVRPGGPVPFHEVPPDGKVLGEAWQALAPLRYFNERAGSIYAGSNEIQRNILARSVIGV
ncbi:acyl-CoA dehydrogenase family protein [Novosphingobium sp. YJ-S2-02]|uniref:Acyl-CoA dehydrogenase family protein n=1 Tax=Novosphingobium aureum TaxID=2792964 RepID=A0A931H9V7_9SPHN|nr:acyl-CoA dehydrogenase family protein [Novosphingobium aureum]MBH0112040.1 acyl-CoA dehydrogenase family protein [Novosphingobium aureum]